MRLSLFEIETILKAKNSVFGKESKIYLFGSRTDDSKKGGDIDLYVQTGTCDSLLDKKFEFLSLIEQALGEQKIDVVFDENKNKAIDIEAKTNGIELNIDAIKLQKYFDECDKHLQRIKEAYGDIERILPISTEKYQQLGKDDVQAIDQYLFRFAKLQDTLGDKIFRALIRQYEDNGDTLSFIDVLNKLEKIGFISSAKEWSALRRIRNEISHQYDDEPDGMSQAINQIMNQKSVIEEIYLKVKNKYQDSSRQRR